MEVTCHQGCASISDRDSIRGEGQRRVSLRIGLGVAGFPFTGPAAFWRWVDLCEESDVDSVWLNERLVSAQPFLEPVSALAAVAGRTRASRELREAYPVKR